MKRKLLYPALFFGGFWLFFWLFQQPGFYQKTLCHFTQNWTTNEEGQRYLADKPYEKLTNDNYIQWDGVHYQRIKNHWYDVKAAGGDYIFAFFPLFPAIWKASMLPPLGVIFLNFLMFALGSLLLLRLINPERQGLNYILSLALPGMVVFLIPYTEATFFLMMSVAFYGFLKRKYAWYFAGLLLAAMARPSVTILLISFVCTEFFFFLQHRQSKTLLLHTARNILPIIVGTLIVMLFQNTFVGGSLTKFFQVQEYWNHQLAVPHNITDWSHEGFSMNLPTLLVIAIPLMAGFAIHFFSKISKPEPVNFTYRPHLLGYLQVLSVIYLVGTALFVVLYQSGSLHGMFRYVLCTPFFYLLLYSGFRQCEKVPARFRLFLWLSLLLTGLFALGFMVYSTYWNFSDLGFFILLAALGLWLLQDLENAFYRGLLYLLIFINIIWTTYLFNTYISNGWIFT